MTAARDTRLPTAMVALLFAVAVLGVGRLQPQLAATLHRTKAREDVFVLPPPAELRVATLGYVAATVDLLWAKLLVDYGIHWAEHRPFPDLNLYLDAIVALEPAYRPLYTYVDTMLVYRPIHGTEQDARDARRYLERGTLELPSDHEVWLHYGQFIAFLAPSFLSSKEDVERWRHDGALAIQRAVELGADPDRSLAAAAVLSRKGEREASIQMLQRAYALADDEDERAQIARNLGALEQSQEIDAAQRTVRAVEGSWRSEYPFVTRGEFLLLGPIEDPLRCVGPRSSGKAECAHDWPEALRPALQ